MLVDFDTLPDSARVWIYQSNRKIAEQEVVEMKAGQKRKSERKFFPGYVLVQMDLDDETWHLVKNTPRPLHVYKD